MKKFIILLVSLFVFTLSACEPDDNEILDYSDFPSHLISTYEEAETISANKYIVYYYSTNCGHCVNMKPTILAFFDTFETLPFYIFNIAEAKTDVSSMEEFVGTPTVFVMSSNDVLESYIGTDQIDVFISNYESISLDYISFESQHINTYQAALDVERDSYILYYYLDNCPHCISVKESLITWAFTRSVEEIYFMNGANVIEPDEIPTELTILNSGTPILLIMSNGEFTGEYYSGSDDVLQFILDKADLPLVTED